MSNLTEKMQIVEENIQQDLAEYQLTVLFASTGAGKTTVALSTIAKKKCIYLVNRTALNDDVKMRVQELKLENVEIKTYQQIERMGQDRAVALLNQYEFVICDEAHYWTCDCKFNKNVYISFEAVMKCRAPKLFMTATGQSLFGALAAKNYMYKGTWYGDVAIWYTDNYASLRGINGKKNNIWHSRALDDKDSPDFEKHEVIIGGKTEKFSEEIDASDYLKSLGIAKFKTYCLVGKYRSDVKFHFVSREHFRELLLMQNDKKTILFTGHIKSTGKNSGIADYEKILNENGISTQVIISAGNNAAYKKYDSENVRKCLIEKKQFEAQCLIATTTIDNGIDIIDENITRIFLDFTTVCPETIQQCIGRVRLGEESDDTKLNVYIRELEPPNLIPVETKLSRQIDIAEKYTKKELQSPKDKDDFLEKAQDICKVGINVEVDELKVAALRYELQCVKWRNHAETVRRQLAIQVGTVESDAAEKKRKERQEMCNEIDMMSKILFDKGTGTTLEAYVDKATKDAIKQIAKKIQKTKPPKEPEGITALFEEYGIPLRVEYSKRRKDDKHLWRIEYASGIRFREKTAGDVGEHYIKLVPEFMFDGGGKWQSMFEIEKIIREQQALFRQTGDYPDIYFD